MYYFRTFIFSNSKIEILVSFSRSTNVSVNMPFPNSNFEENFITYQDLKSECCTSRHIRILHVQVLALHKKVYCMSKYLLYIITYTTYQALASLQSNNFIPIPCFIQGHPACQIFYITTHITHAGLALPVDMFHSCNSNLF